MFSVQCSGKPGFSVALIVAVFVAALMAGCSGDGILDSEDGRLTKRVIRGPVDLVIRLEPAMVGAEIAFTRSVSGRPVDYAWSTTTDHEGYGELRIEPDGTDVGGYYSVRATSADGLLLGNWYSIPINGGTTTDLVLGAGGGATATARRNAITFLYPFENSDDGWVGGFADVPVDTTDLDFKLLYEAQRPLPSILMDDRSVPYIQSDNRSDDTFMFIKRKIGGLHPNTSYAVGFSVEFATSLRSGAVGVGGSSESVFMKAGVTLVEPVPVAETGTLPHLRMNIDKGNQANGGMDMVVIGNAAKFEGPVPFVFQFKTNGTREEAFPFNTDASGEAWLIVGTDSGFESLTQLYWSRIRATFTPE